MITFISTIFFFTITSSNDSNELVRDLFNCLDLITILQDDEEKVKVEESFQSKSFPGDDGKGSASAEDTGEGTSSSVLERWSIKVEQSVNIALTILDVFNRDRDYARFFALETIARVSYFAFMSVLHLYENFGWWRRADYLKVHFAESWNKMNWWYLFTCTFMYHFSECVEMHAFETYDKFLKLQGDELKKLPASEVVVKYYTKGDLYLFDEFQTARPPNSRRPKIGKKEGSTLKFVRCVLTIRDDETEHCNYAEDVGVKFDRPAGETPAEVETEVVGA
ncbi:hypothetical protein MKW92_043029 [Papaver armeniacum]|nr:hypothetical protein MKW92_043029 [Papaver armeniacum]